VLALIYENKKERIELRGMQPGRPGLMKIEFEHQYPRSLDSGFGLAIGAREWNEGGAEKNVRSRAAV
jgi:hypothetical protein